MSETKKISDVCVGDCVVVINRSGPYCTTTVTRITKTRIITTRKEGETALSWRNRDGERNASSTWEICYITPATPELIKKIKFKNMCYKIYQVSQTIEGLWNSENCYANGINDDTYNAVANVYNSVKEFYNFMQKKEN